MNKKRLLLLALWFVSGLLFSFFLTAEVQAVCYSQAPPGRGDDFSQCNLPNGEVVYCDSANSCEETRERIENADDPGDEVDPPDDSSNTSGRPPGACYPQQTQPEFVPCEYPDGRTYWCSNEEICTYLGGTLENVSGGADCRLSRDPPNYTTTCRVEGVLLFCRNAEACRACHDDPDCAPGRTDEIVSRSYTLCNNVNSSAEAYGECASCYEDGGIWTGIGCLQLNPREAVPQLLRFFVGIGGGFALLIMLYGALTITVSAGDPERVQQGKEIITSAISGLLLIVFSVIIMQFIGIEILQIPGF